MIDENDKKIVENMIKEQIAFAMRFSKRKIGDMPTDDNQLTPRGYVNLNGTRASKPSIVSVGQQYFSTDDNYPWFTDGTKWRSSTGSIVSGI